MDQFIKQAADYVGRPSRWARATSPDGEKHFLLEMKCDDRSTHYLDWIGAELAEEPDEWGDEMPDYPGIVWKKIR